MADAPTPAGRCGIDSVEIARIERLLAETPAATLEDATIVVAYLGALGGPRHAQVVAALRGLVVPD